MERYAIERLYNTAEVLSKFDLDEMSVMMYRNLFDVRVVA